MREASTDRDSTERERLNRALLLLGVGAMAGLLAAERARPLRPAPQAPGRRLFANVAMIAASLAVIRALERPWVDPLAARVEREGLGLLSVLPAGARGPVGVLLLDYTLYLWHVLCHRVGPLWRLHQAHHSDHALDTSTALRFHFGEMGLSVLWRWAQVRLLGTGPATLNLWRRLTTASVLFHHSNLRLPEAVERVLSRLIATPRLHTIHHSTVQAERDSNWSSGLVLWDLLHGTWRYDPPPERVRIGDGTHDQPLSAVQTVLLPFRSANTRQAEASGRAGSRA